MTIAHDLAPAPVPPRTASAPPRIGGKGGKTAGRVPRVSIATRCGAASRAARCRSSSGPLSSRASTNPFRVESAINLDTTERPPSAMVARSRPSRWPLPARCAPASSSRVARGSHCGVQRQRPCRVELPRRRSPPPVAPPLIAPPFKEENKVGRPPSWATSSPTDRRPPVAAGPRQPRPPPHIRHRSLRRKVKNVFRSKTSEQDLAGDDHRDLSPSSRSAQPASIRWPSTSQHSRSRRCIGFLSLGGAESFRSSPRIMLHITASITADPRRGDPASRGVAGGGCHRAAQDHQYTRHVTIALPAPGHRPGSSSSNGDGARISPATRRSCRSFLPGFGIFSVLPDHPHALVAGTAVRCGRRADRASVSTGKTACR